MTIFYLNIMVCISLKPAKNIKLKDFNIIYYKFNF